MLLPVHGVKRGSPGFLFSGQHFKIGTPRGLRPWMIEIAALHDGARVSSTPTTTLNAWCVREKYPAMKNARKSSSFNDAVSKRG